MDALPGVLDQTGEVDQALWQADPSVSCSGTVAAQSQATQGPAAGYVWSSAPWDTLCCHLTWTVGMGEAYP